MSITLPAHPKEKEMQVVLLWEVLGKEREHEGVPMWCHRAFSDVRSKAACEMQADNLVQFSSGPLSCRADHCSSQWMTFPYPGNSNHRRKKGPENPFLTQAIRTLVFALASLALRGGMMGLMCDGEHSSTQSTFITAVHRPLKKEMVP